MYTQPSDTAATAGSADTSQGQPSHDLRVERSIDASPQELFDGFIAMYGDSRPDWITDSELDLRVGGAWAVSFRPQPDEAFSESRVITELDPPHRLAYTMTATATDSRPTIATAVTLTFTEQGPSTRACLEQRGFSKSEVRDEFAGAWSQVLELLERRVVA